jgi:hypothetical protein
MRPSRQPTNRALHEAVLKHTHTHTHTQVGLFTYECEAITVVERNSLRWSALWVRIRFLNPQVRFRLCVCVCFERHPSAQVRPRNNCPGVLLLVVQALPAHADSLM